MKAVILVLLFAASAFASEEAVTQESVDGAFNELNETLEGARMVPNFEDGKPAGYKKYTGVTPGSKLDQLGLREGDTISIEQSHAISEEDDSSREE